MSWRTIIISRRCKLDYKMGYMVVRAEDTKRVFLEEVAILLIENPAVSLTGCLLEELIRQKIKVIFCDSERSPLAELVSYYGNHDSNKRIRMQIAWQKETKDLVWTKIVSEKIFRQAEFLRDLHFTAEHDLLQNYLKELKPADLSNREGHAAKVYFNAVFGEDFYRGANDPVNAALDYGYTLILSAFNREIVANGYMTQLGIHHDNVFNHFNLSSDLMEPVRVMVDRRVFSLDPDEFEHWEKMELVSLLNAPVLISGNEQTLLNAIKIYVRSVLDALSQDDPEKIQFIQVYEL